MSAGGTRSYGETERKKLVHETAVYKKMALTNTPKLKSSPKFLTLPYKDGTDRYRARAECAHCPLVEQCLTEAQRAQSTPCRQLRTTTAAHQRAQRHRERSRSPEGRAIRLQRFAAEGVFGHANRFHNGDTTPYRDGQMTRLAQMMVAFVMNLETLASETSPGKTHANTTMT
jgi:Ni/Co efflux regulator RcnB